MGHCLKQEEVSKPRCSEWSDTDKDEYSLDAGFHDEDILLEGCGKGAKEDNSDAADEAQAHKHRKTPPTAKKASVDSEAEPRRKRRHWSITNIG